MSQRNEDNDDRRAQKQKRDQPKLKTPKRFSVRFGSTLPAFGPTKEMEKKM